MPARLTRVHLATNSPRAVAGAAADSPMELFRMKHAAEEHLRESGADWTIVRATAFLEL
jgi:NADH dehydrogenase